MKIQLMKWLLCSLLLVPRPFFHQPLYAQSDFFRGKTIRIIHGRDAGGSGDLRVKALVPFLQKYIPGHPTMRVLRTGLAARVADNGPDVQLLGKVTDLYFDGDMDASVANTGQVSSRIGELLPVAEIVRRTWTDIETALDAARFRI